MITVTLNPSLDRALHLTALRVGEVNRADRSRLDAGGKGINITRVLHQNGLRSVAVFPVGGPDGHVLVSELAASGVHIRPVPIDGATRSNVTLVDASGTTTKINAPGPRLSPVELDEIAEAVRIELNHGATAVVAAGSLPDGVPDTFLPRLAALAHAHGADYAVDTSGAPLVAALAAGGLSVVKPNDEELAELVGRELNTVADVVSAARGLLDAAAAVLVSLGAHGALLITADGVWWAGGPALVPLSTVGAGDSTLAGWLAARDLPVAERLRTAVAWGRAAVLLPGTEMPRPHHLDLASVRVVCEPSSTLSLKEL